MPNFEGIDFGWDANGLELGNGEANGNWNAAGGDLGMGLGWEGMDHDFSEGGNGALPDLFEGFFFGGGANY